MVEPILISIATTLATKAAGGLYDLVRVRFSRHPEAARALTAAEGAVPDSAPVLALAERLAEVTATDPEFARQLRVTWSQTEVTQRGQVNNQISGTVTGKVVQAGDIHGNVSF
jgi:hypothetical protein